MWLCKIEFMGKKIGDKTTRHAQGCTHGDIVLVAYTVVKEKKALAGEELDLLRRERGPSAITTAFWNTHTF